MHLALAGGVRLMDGATGGMPGAPHPDHLGCEPGPVPPDVLDRLRRWVRTCLDLRADEPVIVTQAWRAGTGRAPVHTLLAVLRPSGPVRRAIPLPADLVSVADVRQAFAGEVRGESW